MSSKYPRHARDLDNLASACKEYVLPGYWPSKPVLKKTDPVWTMGSCFADNVKAALMRAGVPCASISLKERNNSPPLLRLFTQKLITEVGEARDFVAAAKCAIITLGVAAAQYSPSGELLYSDAETVGDWKPISAAAAQADIAATVTNLRTINPNLIVILTVSPVPVNRSPWRHGAVTADCISKSTLRVAVEQYLESRPDKVAYWPAFEIVRWLGAHKPGMYGADDELQRHVSNGVVDLITGLFVEAYVEH